MIGASARYSGFRVPVETSTAPRRRKVRYAPSGASAGYPPAPLLLLSKSKLTSISWNGENGENGEDWGTLGETERAEERESAGEAGEVGAGELETIFQAGGGRPPDENKMIMPFGAGDRSRRRSRL